MIIDVRQWVQGKKRNENLDWDEILPKAPLLKQRELPQDALVGVVHNIGYWKQDGGPQANFNLYAVVLFMSKSL